MTGTNGSYRFVAFVVGAGILFLANRQSFLLLASWSLSSASAAYLSLFFIYGWLFFLCDWVCSRGELRKTVYFFFRGASLGALYLTPHIILAAAAPLGSFTHTALFVVVGAIIIAAGQILTRILFSANEERSFYR